MWLGGRWELTASPVPQSHHAASMRLLVVSYDTARTAIQLCLRPVTCYARLQVKISSHRMLPASGHGGLPALQLETDAVTVLWGPGRGCTALQCHISEVHVCPPHARNLSWLPTRHEVLAQSLDKLSSTVNPAPLNTLHIGRCARSPCPSLARLQVLSLPTTCAHQEITFHSSISSAAHRAARSAGMLLVCNRHTQTPL